jgi:SAM-dependent methyltransferase
MNRIFRSKKPKMQGVAQGKQNLIYSGSETLAVIENGLDNYNSSIARMLINYAPKEAMHILDFGAGSGTLAEQWSKRHKLKPDCLEIDPNLCQILKEKGFIVKSNQNDITIKYDYIYSSNVFEHIEDDLAALKDLTKFLEVKGKIAIYVPAFPILFSDFDHSIGHFRRYTKKKIYRLSEHAGLDVDYFQYNDSIGFFVAITARILRYKITGDKKSENLLKIYDRFIWPISRILDFAGFKYLFGKNLLVVLTKKSNES